MHDHLLLRQGTGGAGTSNRYFRVHHCTRRAFRIEKSPESRVFYSMLYVLLHAKMYCETHVPTRVSALTGDLLNPLILTHFQQLPNDYTRWSLRGQYFEHSEDTRGNTPVTRSIDVECISLFQTGDCSFGGCFSSITIFMGPNKYCRAKRHMFGNRYIYYQACQPNKLPLVWYACNHSISRVFDASLERRERERTNSFPLFRSLNPPVDEATIRTCIPEIRRLDRSTLYSLSAEHPKMSGPPSTCQTNLQT